MKKLRLSILLPFFLILVPSIPLNAGEIDILGVTKKIDTLEYKSVGPGIQYTRFNLPEYPLSVYMLTVDLNNPYNLVETFQAGNQAGKTEAMTSAYKRLDSEMHRSISGINGNFWIVASQGQPDVLLGVPHSGSVLNGEFITDPNDWNRGHGSIGFAMIDVMKKAWIDDITFAGTVEIPGIGEYPISEINRIRKNNELVLFNNFLGAQPTHTDDDGIEVFIRPVEGNIWKVNGYVECEVIRKVVNKGSNYLQTGETVLSGNGTARTFLENLSAGDKLLVNMSVKTLSDEKFPSVNQMITGNALVMKNGTLTNRNYNEAYNTQLYPRTGIGSSQDGKTLYFIVIDKGPKSVGANTETMCGILKARGAENVTSMDGGGSAQMMLDGRIVNSPSDGKERPVANGWFLFHNAPDDDTITRIDIADHRIVIPSYSSFMPVVLGYNRYGVLVDKNVSGFSLSCSPNIGTIADNNILIASANSGVGTITVSLNGVETTKRVEVVSGKISLRCDSVLIDARKNYSVEVLSYSTDVAMPISPEFLAWEVKDPQICEIDKGILKGLKNGRTMVIGSLAQFKDTLVVSVENPLSPVMVADSVRTGDWTMTATAFLKAQWNTENLPAGWQTGSAVNFVHAAGRAPFIKLTNQKSFYGLPDTVKLTMNVGNIDITRAILTFKNNLTQTKNIEFTTMPKNQDFSLDVPVDELFDTNDLAIYPVSFDNINFYLDAANMTPGTAYSLAVKEIALVYKDYIITHLPSETSNMFRVYPNPISKGKDLKIKLMDVYVNERLDLRWYDLHGKLVKGEKLLVNGDEVNTSTREMERGTYLLNIKTQGKTQSVKIILK